MALVPAVEKNPTAEGSLSRWRSLRYGVAYSLPLLVIASLLNGGPWLLLPLLYLYGLLPLIELLLPTSAANLTPAQEKAVLEEPLYDWLLYLAVPTQYAVLTLFFILLPGFSLLELAGATMSVGLMCGVFGINIAHELGHRPATLAQRLAQALLLSSLYMHFFIEHNRGHHRRVATEQDPASARLGEPLFAFWLRSIRDGYRSAWQLEHQRLARLGLPALSRHNQMLLFQLIQLLALLIIGVIFGPLAALCFVLAASTGILMLETVNYIEHYGLSRKPLEPSRSDTKEKSPTDTPRYERVQPHHSWNSDHWLGRLTLFELTRHSDHHFRASRHYQVLRHHPHSPQMPAGYPAMMMLACLPPLWFAVMDPRARAAQAYA